MVSSSRNVRLSLSMSFSFLNTAVKEVMPMFPPTTQGTPWETPSLPLRVANDMLILYHL